MRGERPEGGGHGHRIDRLAGQIREEVSQIVGYELRDERVGLATVTDVRLAPDMSIARISVSVAGSSDEKAKSIAALNGAAAFVRRLLAPRMRTKKIPSLIFSLDTLLERGNRIDDLLKEDEQ